MEASELVRSTVRNQLLARSGIVCLSVRDRVTVGGGRIVLGSSPKMRQMGFLRTTAIRCTVKGRLEAKQRPHPHLAVQWRNLRIFQLHASLYVSATPPGQAMAF